MQNASINAECRMQNAELRFEVRGATPGGVGGKREGMFYPGVIAALNTPVIHIQLLAELGITTQCSITL